MDISKFKKIQQSRTAKVGDKMDIKAVQKFTNEQPFIIGEDYPIVVGDSKTNDVNLAGQTGMLVGLNLYSTAGGEVKFSLQINKETVISDTNQRFYNPKENFNTKGKEYFEVNRPLSGSDKVVLTVSSINAGRLYAAYYIQPYIIK